MHRLLKQERERKNKGLIMQIEKMIEDIKNTVSSVALVALSPKTIASMCMELHPAAENEIEAVDIRINFLDKLIRLKIAANVDAADDIQAFFCLSIAKRELMQSTLLVSLKPKYQSGGRINGTNRN